LAFPIDAAWRETLGRACWPKLDGDEAFVEADAKVDDAALKSCSTLTLTLDPWVVALGMLGVLKRWRSHDVLPGSWRTVLGAMSSMTTRVLDGIDRSGPDAYCGPGYDLFDRIFDNGRCVPMDPTMVGGDAVKVLVGLRVAVAGAGALGLTIALCALEAGAEVEVWDPAGPLDNASGVAAGMIAPVAEAVFDGLGASHRALLAAARDRWPGLASRVLDLELDRSGTLLCFPDRVRLAAALSGLLEGEAAAAGPSSLFAAGDWRVDPRTALPALRRAVTRLGGQFVARRLDLGERTRWDRVILASGPAARSDSATAPELSVLRPIKGQIVHFAGGPASGPVVRTAELYLVPHKGGAVAGATMEPDRDDRTVEIETILRLRALAISVHPELQGVAFKGDAGVRTAAPDALPLVGPSSTPGLMLAVGARRNGWLLAPLVGEILVSYLSGGDGGAFGPIVAPSRWFAD